LRLVPDSNDCPSDKRAHVMPIIAVAMLAQAIVPRAPRN